jgi:hypothetical protein
VSLTSQAVTVTTVRRKFRLSERGCLPTESPYRERKRGERLRREQDAGSACVPRIASLGQGGGRGDLLGTPLGYELTGVPSVGCRHWRREGDSNPRNRCRFSGFQDHLFHPLTHPSEGPFYSEICKFVRQPRCFLGFGADQRLRRVEFDVLVNVFFEKDAPCSWQRLRM